MGVRPFMFSCSCRKEGVLTLVLVICRPLSEGSQSLELYKTFHLLRCACLHELRGGMPHPPDVDRTLAKAAVGA